MSNHRFTDDEPLDPERACDVIEHAVEHGFTGFGGDCGVAAVAMNKVLFGGRGKYWAAVNAYQWDHDSRLSGHVAVAYGGHLWDVDGVWEDGAKAFPGDAPEDFKSWGMLDPEDPDYSWPDGAEIGEIGELANDVALVELTEDDVRRIFHPPRSRKVSDLVKILEESKSEVLG